MEDNVVFQSDGWPIQAWFWLEWGSSTAGQSLPAALSRFRVVYSDSISTVPHSLLHNGSASNVPTQAKTGLEWATHRILLPQTIYEIRK
jgi:hypothetical protein